jgi:hypothetical protein
MSKAKVSVFAAQPAGRIGVNARVSLESSFKKFASWIYLILIATCGVGISMRTRTFIDRAGRKKCPHITVGKIWRGFDFVFSEFFDLF